MGLYILPMGLLALIIGILGPSAWHLCEKYLSAPVQGGASQLCSFVYNPHQLVQYILP